MCPTRDPAVVARVHAKGGRYGRLLQPLSGVERGSCIVDVPALRPVQKGEPQRPAEAERRLRDQRGHRQETVRCRQEPTHVEGSIVGVASEPALAGSRLRFRGENDQRDEA